MPAPTAFSVPNDAPINLSKDKRRNKRKRRIRKIKSFLNYDFVKNSTGLTSIQNSSMLNDPNDIFDQGVVLSLPGNAQLEPMPGDIEKFPGEFTYPFGFGGGEVFDLPPANYGRAKLSDEDIARNSLDTVEESTDKISDILKFLTEYIKDITVELKKKKE